MGKVGILRITSLVLAGVIVISAIGGGIYLYSSSRRLQSLKLQPNFSEDSLNIGTQYSFSVITSPSKAKVTDLKCVIDDPNSSYEIDDNGMIILTTGNAEKTLSIYVASDDIQSKTLSYSIVDFDAHTEAEAAAKSEANARLNIESKTEPDDSKNFRERVEESELPKLYVKVVGDNVNIRSTNSIDGDILGKARKGEKFEKFEEISDWTHILYNDKDAFIKTEFLDTIFEEEYYRESIIDKEGQISNDLPDNNSTITGTGNNTPEKIAEKLDAKADASLPSTSLVVNKAFSCKISDFQYIPYNYPGLEGGYYQKNEIYELKVGETLNYTVGITNDTGKLFTQTGGTILSNSAPTENNLVGLTENLGLINPGSTQIALQGSIKKDEACQESIRLGIQESGNPLELQGPFGPTYTYEITVKWIK